MSNMGLQLNNLVIDFREFYGASNEQMPLLIGEGRIPLSAAGLMRRYLEVLEFHRNAPKELKLAYAPLLRAWEDNHFGTDDGAARHRSGRMKVVPDALYLRFLTPETRLVNGAVDLSDGYTALDGEEFSKADVDKYCGMMPLSRSDAKNNPVWLALAMGDKALHGEFVDARFSRAEELLRHNVNIMCVHAPPVPKEGAAGRLWVVGRLVDYGSDAVGSSRLDYDYGRLVGVASEAQRAAAWRKTLEQRV